MKLKNPWGFVCGGNNAEGRLSEKQAHADAAARKLKFNSSVDQLLSDLEGNETWVEAYPRSEEIDYRRYIQNVEAQFYVAARALEDLKELA